MVSELPSTQKLLININDSKERDILLSLYKFKDKDVLLKKISRYKTKSELLGAIKLFTSDARSTGYANIKGSIEKSGSKIIYDSHILYHIQDQLDI